MNQKTTACGGQQTKTMENDFIDDFIEEYKSQPCLWQASSVDFKNRKKRQEAYYKLIEVASRHGEHYNIERTKQKINNLRCAFRHQLKKFTESKNNKGGKEDTYCPKRRYFESLMFLLNEETPDKKQADILKENINKKTKEVCDKSNTHTTTTITETYAIPVQEKTLCQQQQQHQQHQQQQQQLQQQQQQRESTQSQQQINPQLTNQENAEVAGDNVMQIEVQCDEEVNILWPRPSEASNLNETVQVITSVPAASASIKEIESQPPRPSSAASHISTHSTKSENAPKKVKVDCSTTNFEKLLNIACSKITTSDAVEDDFSIFGKMVAYKLRSMDHQQSLIAEKLITDILLEGQMKMLQYPIRVPYRQEGQAYVISGLSINGATEQQQQHSGRENQHTTPTIHYTTTNASQL